MMAGAKVYSFISSMKAGIILLGLIAVMGAVGSLLLPQSYFQTPLFKLLLLLLSVNMTVCMVNRLANFTAKIRKGTLPNHCLKQMGTIFLHGGMVLILVGGAISLYYGQYAQIRLLEDDDIDISSLIHTTTPVIMHLNRFEIEFNQDGSPSQYNSAVSLLSNEHEVRNFVISVNHPLKFEGVKAYQESYGNLIWMESSFEPGSNASHLFQEGDLLNVPESERQIKIFKYVPNFDPEYGMNSRTLRPDNPKIIYSVYERGALMSVGAASPGEKLEVADGKYLVFKGVKPFTVLKIKNDPGMPLAAAGGALLMGGVCIALVFHPAGGKRRVKAIAASWPLTPNP